jgi:hypothetical protein
MASDRNSGSRTYKAELGRLSTSLIVRIGELTGEMAPSILPAVGVVAYREVAASFAVLPSRRESWGRGYLERIPSSNFGIFKSRATQPSPVYTTKVLECINISYWADFSRTFLG